MKENGGKVDSPGLQGDRGIPPGIRSSGMGEVKGKVESPGTGGDKGIPPMGKNPSAKAPKD